MAQVPEHIQPCTIVGISMEDPAAAVRDPKLTALVSSGWRVVAHVPAQRAGRTEWILLMAPPRPKVTPKADDRVPMLLAMLGLMQLLFWLSDNAHHLLRPLLGGT